MPIYEHTCPDCGSFDDYRKIKDAAKLPACPECGHKKCARVWQRRAQAVVKVIGSGDTTTAIYDENKQPYRFKTGTEKEQKQELKRELEAREADVPERFRRGHYDVF